MRVGRPSPRPWQVLATGVKTRQGHRADPARSFRHTHCQRHNTCISKVNVAPSLRIEFRVYIPPPYLLIGYVPSYARLHYWTALGLPSSNALAMGIDSIAKRLFRQFALLPLQAGSRLRGQIRTSSARAVTRSSSLLPLSIEFCHPFLQVLPDRHRAVFVSLANRHIK